jgi:hypothetical protein
LAHNTQTMGESCVTSLLDDPASVFAAAADTKAITGFGREHWREWRDQNGCRRGTEWVKGGVIGVLLRHDGSCSRIPKLGMSAR